MWKRECRSAVGTLGKACTRMPWVQEAVWIYVPARRGEMCPISTPSGECRGSSKQAWSSYTSSIYVSDSVGHGPLWPICVLDENGIMNENNRVSALVPSSREISLFQRILPFSLFREITFPLGQGKIRVSRQNFNEKQKALWTPSFIRSSTLIVNSYWVISTPTTRDNNLFFRSLSKVWIC